MAESIYTLYLLKHLFNNRWWDFTTIAKGLNSVNLPFTRTSVFRRIAGMEWALELIKGLL